MATPEEWDNISERLTKLEAENRKLKEERDYFRSYVIDLLEEKHPFPELDPEEYQRIIEKGNSRELHDIIAEAEKELAEANA